MRTASRILRVALACALFLVAAAAGDVAPRLLLLDAALTRGGEIIVIGERGTILRSDADARDWQRVSAPTRATLTAIAFAPGDSARRGWAVGHDALILATNDGGRTWSKQFQGDNLQDSFLDVLALDQQRGLAIGSFGLARATADGGSTWTRRELIDDDSHLNRITRGPTGTLYVAGERGTLLRSTDDGATWTKIPTPYEGSFYGIVPLDGRTLIAHGLRGNVFRSTDDGASWTRLETPHSALLSAGIKTHSGAILLAGHARSLLISRDGGASFTAAETPFETSIAELLELPDGRVLAVGEAGVTLMPAMR